jgi:23S rRNA G2069 N7-methylase RlmK/C1962 C5-methylase RlmI
MWYLCSSEGDRLSGLIVDVYGKCAVASSSAAWIEANKEAVIAALKTQAGMEEVVWRPALEMLKLEGITLHSTAEPALQV